MKRNLLLAIICIILIAVITLLSATGIGFSSEEFVAPSVPKTQVSLVIIEGKNPNLAGPVVYSVTYTNTFLPRQRQLPFVTACLYNSEAKRGMYLGTRWQLSSLNSQGFSDGSNIIQLNIETKTLNLEVQPFVRYAERPVIYAPDSPPIAKPVPAMEESYDSILLFIEDDGRSQKAYPQCEFLQEEDVAKAKKVALV